MSQLPAPSNDDISGLPVFGLPKGMNPPAIKVGSGNEFLKADNPAFAKKLETSFLESKLYDITRRDKNEKEIKDYNLSENKLSKYNRVAKDDADFNLYLRKMYGSIDNFFNLNEEFTNIHKTFNPKTDFQAEVVIITKDTFYKADFISQNETIMEMLSGICTVEYFKVDGRISKITTTLSSEFIPDSQNDVRSFAFGGLPGRRVLCWDLVKEKWSSFYMKNLKRFIRDETSGIE